MKAFGLTMAKKLLKHWPYVYCPTLGSLFTKNANPKVGDIVIFYRSGEFRHTGLLLLIQVVAAVFGITIDLGDMGNKLLAVVNAVFAVLTILGVVTDPTTDGITDSIQALGYTEPKKDEI